MLKKIKIEYEVSKLLKKAAVLIGKSSVIRKLVDEDNMSTWEYSVFSQNGEDGILEFLAGKILNPNKFFVEIGASNGLENNSAYFAICKKWCGICIEGNKLASEICKAYLAKVGAGYPWVKSMNVFVDSKNINILKNEMLTLTPDVFILDIDGNDYYVLKSILNEGILPKILVVEYNSTFGLKEAITIPYREDFYVDDIYHLYYGVSIQGWRNMLEEKGYTFLGVESRGVNAFFVRKEEFSTEFIEKVLLNRVDFKDNLYDTMRMNMGQEDRYKLIKDMEFYHISR